MKALLVIALLLVSGAVYAESTDVPLKDYLENRIDEQDRRIQQEQASARIAIEAALSSEIRRQDEERNARFALKTEVIDLRERVVNLEGSRATTFVGILILGLLGAFNLVKLFWGK